MIARASQLFLPTLRDDPADAEAVIDEQGGHTPDPNLVTERFGWLVQPV